MTRDGRTVIFQAFTKVHPRRPVISSPVTLERTKISQHTNLSAVRWVFRFVPTAVLLCTLQLRLSVLLSKCIARGANGLVAWEPGIFCATVSSGMYTAVHIYLHASCCLKGGPARRRQTQLTASANNDRQHTKQAPSLYLQLGGPRVVAIHNAIFAM